SILLRDPFHLSETILVVSMSAVPVLQRLDGRHTLEQISEEFKKEHGVDVSVENIRTLVEHLESARFLEGESFETWRRGVKKAFLESPTRPSFLAGRSYEEDPAALRKQLEGLFTHPEGPGLPSPNGADGAPPLRGAVVPHIDFQRGGTTFAWTYRAVAEHPAADTYVVLGTIHAPTEGTYTLSRKAFETPLGAQEVDVGFVDALARRAPGDLFRDEFAQRCEHSIEFQAVFLRHLFGGKREVKFVPLLVGSFGKMVMAGKSPAGSEEVEGFTAALRETISEWEAAGRKVCLLASVDLAHVGPRFGDPDPVDEARLEAVRREDTASLEAVCRGDAEAFYWSVARDGDQRKVCGLAPIYTLLRVLEGCKGEVLRYSQWPDPNGTVTFCSMAIR
ncbi:MAG: AmmeMemoRadiSam system protein B, partial [bacterium]